MPVGKGLSPLQLFMLRRCAEVGYCARTDIKGLFFKLPIKASVSVVSEYAKLKTKDVSIGQFADALFDTSHPQYDSVCVAISRSIQRLQTRKLVSHTYVRFCTKNQDVKYYDFALHAVRLTSDGLKHARKTFGEVLEPEISTDILEFVTVKGSRKLAQGKPIILTVKATAKSPQGKPLNVTVKASGRATPASTYKKRRRNQNDTRPEGR